MMGEEGRDSKAQPGIGKRDWGGGQLQPPLQLMGEQEPKRT